MLRRIIIVLLLACTAACLGWGVASYRWRFVHYQSTDRYCLRWKVEAGRVGLLFDGSAGVLRPIGPSFHFAGIELNDSGLVRTWRTVDLWIPIWYLAGLFALYPVIVVTRGVILRRRRVRGRLCRFCGYDLRGNVSGVCPECGMAHAEGGSSLSRAAERVP